MNVKDYFDYIDFSPMFEKIKESGIKLNFITERINESPAIFQSIKNRKSLPSTNLICGVASFLNVPISTLVKLTGFEVRDFFVEKEFTPNFNPEHKLTYQPLRDLVEKYKKEGQSIQDVYDKVSKLDINNGIKDRVEYMLIKGKGVTTEIHHAKEGEKFYTDASGKKRRAGGLSATNRAKMNRDESVSFRIIYDICKALRCNVDFVLGWK